MAEPVSNPSPALYPSKASLVTFLVFTLSSVSAGSAHPYFLLLSFFHWSLSLCFSETKRFSRTPTFFISSSAVISTGCNLPGDIGLPSVQGCLPLSCLFLSLPWSALSELPLSFWLWHHPLAHYGCVFSVWTFLIFSIYPVPLNLK